MTQNFRNRLVNLKNNLADALLGQQAPNTDAIEMNELLKGVDTSSPYYIESMGEEAPAANITASSTPRSGGILNDLASGYKDNYATGFAASNWGNNSLPDGRNKGFAYKLGEGLGSVGRFMDSPVGRGLLAAGLNKAMGYDDSLIEGLTAAVGRQNAQTADRIYRQQLADQGVDTSNVGGNLTSDIYRQLLYGQQLRDNAQWRKDHLEQQLKQNEIMNQMRQDQLQFQKDKADYDRYARGQQIAQGWTRIADARSSKAAKNNDIKSAQDGLASLTAIEKQLNNYQEMFKTLPGKLNTYTVGKLAEKTGMQSEKQAEFESRTNLLFNKIARDLGGEKGVLSDQDIARVKDAMPKYTDSLAQKNAKMKAINDLLTIAKEKYQYKLSTMAIPVETNYNSDDEGWAF